jgi:hypothetical protein
MIETREALEAVDDDGDAFVRAGEVSGAIAQADEDIAVVALDEQTELHDPVLGYRPNGCIGLYARSKSS